jgi:hypothetical protein
MSGSTTLYTPRIHMQYLISFQKQTNKQKKNKDILVLKMSTQTQDIDSDILTPCQLSYIKSIRQIECVCVQWCFHFFCLAWFPNLENEVDIHVCIYTHLYQTNTVRICIEADNLCQNKQRNDISIRLLNVHFSIWCMYVCMLCHLKHTIHTQWSTKPNVMIKFKDHST